MRRKTGEREKLDRLRVIIKFLETERTPEELKKNPGLTRELYREIKSHCGPLRVARPAFIIDHSEDINNLGKNSDESAEALYLLVDDVAETIPEYREAVKGYLGWEKYKEELGKGADPEFSGIRLSAESAPPPPHVLKDFLDVNVPEESSLMRLAMLEEVYGLPHDPLGVLKHLLDGIRDNPTGYCTGCGKVFVRTDERRKYCPRPNTCGQNVRQSRCRLKDQSKGLKKGELLLQRFTDAKKAIEGGKEAPLAVYYLRPKGKEEGGPLPVTTREETYKVMMEELKASRGEEWGDTYIMFVGEAWRPATQGKSRNARRRWIPALIGRVYHADGTVLAKTADIKRSKGKRQLVNERVDYMRLPGWKEAKEDEESIAQKRSLWWKLTH